MDNNTLEMNEESTSDDSDRKFTRFNDGDEITLIRVRFPGNSRSFPFLLGSHPFKYGQKVLAQSDRGLTVGYINSFPYKKAFKKEMLPLQTIARIATNEDIDLQRENIVKEKKAESDCNELIEKYGLDMTLTHVEFMQNGNKVVFYFNAPSRVDFRELVRDLVGILKVRVELRQISVRDRTAAIGAIGACGLQTCCSSFLQNYGHVNIKMPKNQNLSIAQNRINGVCGQIKCCMKYEDDVYTHKKKKLPKEGSFVQLLNGDKGKVLKHHIIKEQFDLLTDKGTINRYSFTVFSSSRSAPPKGWRFPKEFNLITNETNEVITWEVKDINNPVEKTNKPDQALDQPSNTSHKTYQNKSKGEAKSENGYSENNHQGRGHKRKKDDRNRSRNKKKNFD